MARTTAPEQKGRVACAACGRDGRSLPDGWWARSQLNPDEHLCADCYRALHPLEREGWWRPRPGLGVVPALPVLEALACLV
jgi:hypothetical protein